MQNQHMNKLTQYGHSFQTKALVALITDRDFLQQSADIISPNYFDSDASKWIIRKTLNYFHEYHTTPTMEVFKVELENVNNEVQAVAIKEQLKETYKNTQVKDLDYIKNTFLDFCKNQTLKNALMKSVDLLELGNYDDIRNMIDSALKAGLERDLGHEYINQIEDRYRDEARQAIETPWALINKLLLGGLGKGDLGLIAGGPGGGKSWALVAIGAQAVKLGYTVVHYSLELNEKYVGRRYDANLTEIPMNLLENSKEEVQEKLLGLRGGLYIREYPAGQATVTTIQAHLENCIQQGVIPDLVIVDYADLLTSKTSKEKRDKLDDIYTNLRGLATQMKLPIWTASQVNRTGAREEIIQGDRMAESYSKMMITDFAMSLSRNHEDKENGTGRWHIMKNRYGADGMTYNSTMDASIGKIEVIERNQRDSDNNLPPSGNFSSRDRKNLQESARAFLGF